jgi:hypothetical protein
VKRNGRLHGRSGDLNMKQNSLSNLQKKGGCATTRIQSNFSIINHL